MAALVPPVTVSPPENTPVTEETIRAEPDALDTVAVAALVEPVMVSAATNVPTTLFSVTVVTLPVVSGVISLALM